MREEIYNFWHRSDSKLPLNVVMSGISYCDKNYRIERHGEDMYSFEYIIEGSGVLEINSQTLYPQKNDVYLLTANSDHLYYSSEDHPWVKIWVVFYGDFAAYLFKRYLPADTYLIKDCNILSYMNEIIHISSAGNKSYAELIDECSVMLLKIVLRLKNHLEHKMLSAAEQIKLCLDVNIENKLDMNDVCAQFGYSKNYLIKLFRETYGITPYAYFRKHKIELAKHYLLHTYLNINEISVKLNFADQHYFSSSFRAIVGISPSEYRKSHYRTIK
ncbi:helix-turn-helix transcriptional regulator [Paenibacillus sp. MWE-103]|uniref:Helix-turn-helix transcriptional regulator n=1 Tax=Paenibacillus artemisiicola TaxID=1172618 RepID=A0ABS3W9U0_9BACL|nr:AraC family transcriptional regulator [Paenibacillus artemisiicola]MBO7745085.1 helix-turn-helix transcriptional regulator [Paenibacillus artemisiicola]